MNYTFNTWDLVEVNYIATIEAESEELALQYLKDNEDGIEWERTGEEITKESLIYIELINTDESSNNN